MVLYRQTILPLHNPRLRLIGNQRQPMRVRNPTICRKELRQLPPDTAKTTIIAQKTAQAEVKTPELNKIDAKKAFEDELDKLLSIQNREFRWAKLLDCKPGKKPWIVKTGLFVNTDKRANKLIANIRIIDDQELLFRIACESNREDVQLAAVANITDQAFLNKLSTNRNYKTAAPLSSN